MNKLTTFKDLKNAIGNANRGCSVTYRSDVKMRKTGNPLNGYNVTKVVSAVVKYNHNYETSVNNRATTEFKAEPLRWGAWVQGYENCIIEHKGSFYIRMYFNMGIENTKTEYLVDDRYATAQEIATIKEFSSSSSSNRQAQHGVTKEVMPRSIKLENIISFNCGAYSF